MTKGQQGTFLPYSTQSVSEADVAAVDSVLRSNWLTQGPVVPAFEARFAEIHGVAHSVAMNSATAALHLGCLALGVKPGGLVWTSPISFVASANCARYCDARVDFVDIDPITRNMSMLALEEKLRSAKEKRDLPDVVIPIEFTGLPVDRRELRGLADAYGFKVLVNASHSVGAEYAGRVAGNSFADATVFSFHAVKIVTTAEGGLLATDNENVAQRARLLRSHGITRNPSEMLGAPGGDWYYEQIDLGFNYRMTELQGALGLSQLTRLTEMAARRRDLAVRYDRLLRPLPLKLPWRCSDRVSSHHLYVVEIDGAQTTLARTVLLELGDRELEIGVNVHYIPIHTQPYYRSLGFKEGMFPCAEGYYEHALSLPLFPRMSDSDLDRVVDALTRMPW